MAVTEYGLSGGSWEARPDFAPRRDSTGKWTATQTFTMRRDTWEGGASSSFAKGTAITTLFSDLPVYWSFLKLEASDLQFEPGRIVLVRCDFTGYNTAEFDASEVAYTLSGTRTEQSILLHPLFKKDVTDDETRRYFQLTYNGAYVVDPAGSTVSTIQVRNAVNPFDGTLYDFTAYDIWKWAELIFVQGVRTWSAPTIQWTCEATNESGLDSDDLDYLALVEFGGDGQASKPPGNPPVPNNGGPWQWRKISLDQTKSTETGITHSQTWQLQPATAGPFFKNAAGTGDSDPLKGPYNFLYSELDA